MFFSSRILFAGTFGVGRSGAINISEVADTGVTGAIFSAFASTADSFEVFSDFLAAAFFETLDSARESSVPAFFADFLGRTFLIRFFSTIELPALFAAGAFLSVDFLGSTAESFFITRASFFATGAFESSFFTISGVLQAA